MTPLAGSHRDTQWFDELFANYATVVHRYFIRRAPIDDAEDLTAEVLATAWRRRDSIALGGELPWLYRTAGFVLANYRRRVRDLPSAELEYLKSLSPLLGNGSANDPEAEISERERALMAFAQLSARDQEVIRLVAWDGVDRTQLADSLGISVGGADAALSRARARLAAAWATYE
ncbi:hypothetical protein GCM10010401_05740 [Rarobacter faecitabidus]